MVEEMETYLYFNDGDELHDGKFDGLKDEREVKSFRPMDQPICQRGSIQKILWISWFWEFNISFLLMEVIKRRIALIVHQY